MKVNPMLLHNPRAVRTAYPDDLHEILNHGQAQISRDCLQQWRGIAPQPTPIYDLPDAAKRIGVGMVSVKDESQRSSLGSFKALGAPIALVRFLMREHPEWEMAAVFTGRYRDALREQTVISATDGNHGITGNYDESVVEAARLAQANGWQVISDTSYDGYEDVPRDVMQGYATIAAEAIEASAASGQAAYTHVLLQGGVGGLAAGVAAYWWEHAGAARPTFIVVEPEQADCLWQSAVHGQASVAQGTVDSIMAGLACGATSPLAWRFLDSSVDAFMTVSDDEAITAMRQLAAGSERDIPVLAGESGVAGLAALNQLAANKQQMAALGLDEHARVLFISSEGATAPSVYAKAVGETAEAVLARQQQWLAKQTA
jgi:diaminopropionate ammonia-lyase